MRLRMAVQMEEWKAESSGLEGEADIVDVGEMRGKGWR